MTHDKIDQNTQENDQSLDKSVDLGPTNHYQIFKKKAEEKLQRKLQQLRSSRTPYEKGYVSLSYT